MNPIRLRAPGLRVRAPEPRGVPLWVAVTGIGGVTIAACVALILGGPQ